METTDTQWGLYPWFEEHGPQLIHPDDLALVRALVPNGKVFRVIGIEDDFVRLSYGETEFRARPSLFKAVDGEVHGIGESVILKDGYVGEIIGVQWHHQRGEPMYQLRVDGKRKSNRYWNSDFAPPS
jgi:hypothetical protein